MKTYLIVLTAQGAQITSNALCGQPVVWAFDASNGLESDLDVRQLAQTFINSQPLPQNFTRNSTLSMPKQDRENGLPRSFRRCHDSNPMPIQSYQPSS